MQLLITQVLYDGIEMGEGDEFAEVFNPFTFAVSLDGYKIGDEETRGGSEGMYQFPAGGSILPNGTIIVARSAAQFQARFGFAPTFEIAGLTKYSAWSNGSWALSNSGDELLLLGPDDRIVDSVAWENGNFSAVGLTGDASAPESKSLQRYGTQDTNNMTFDFLRAAPRPGVRVVPPPPVAPRAPAPMPNGMFAYWGDLHSHSTVSDGSGPPRQAFDTARAAGLHFFGLTDHDHDIATAEWNELGSAATAASADHAFIGLRGFEYSHLTKGHINVFNTSSWISRDDPAYDSLPEAYAWLASEPNAIAQFNHPATTYGSDFDRFAFNAAAFDKIVLQEVGNNGGTVYTRYEAEYPASLNKGWHIAPSINSDHHEVAWGSDSQHRVGVLAPSLTRANLLDALRARRVFATEDSNLALALQANGAWMGSTVRAEPMLSFTITVHDPSATPLQLFLYDNGTLVWSQSFASANFSHTVSVSGAPSHFYYARAVQNDGDIAYTAPIWTDDTPLPTPVLPTEPARQSRNDLGSVSIETARTTETNRLVNLEGCITVAPGVLSNRFLFIQDATGGIKVYLTIARGDFPSIALGDRLALRGRTRSVSGERQVEIEDVGQLVIRGTCSPGANHYATGRINSSIEGMLVEVRGAVVSASGYNWVLNDGSGDVPIYIDETAGLRWPRLERGQVIRVVGIVSRAGGRTVIIPRYQTDLEFPSTPTPTATRLARAPSPAPRSTFTMTPAATHTPTVTATPTELRVFVRPTFAPAESAMTLDAHAVATVGGSLSVTASFVLFALAWLAYKRQRP